MIKRKTGPEADLRDLRIQIQDVTKSILDLTLARWKLSLRVADIKREVGSPIENPWVESKLLEEVEKHAIHIGLDPELARSIASKLIDSSRIVQRRRLYEERISSFLKENEIRTIGVIGSGRMGKWFVSYFRPVADSIILYDKDRSKAKRIAKEIGGTRVSDYSDLGLADLVVLAVPIGNTLGEIKKLQVLRTKKRKLRVIEVSSIKGPLFQSDAKLISENRKLIIHSIHPMFGASADPFGYNSLIEVGSKTQGFIRNVFPQFKILRMDWKRHDRLMLLMLSLPHELSLLFSEALTKSGVRVKGLHSPSFQTMLQLAKKTLSENPKVYYEIQALNPFQSEINIRIESALKTLRKALGDESDFKRLFEFLNNKMSGF